MPDHVKIAQVDETMNAFGNTVVCNDRVALVHPEISENAESII